MRLRQAAPFVGRTGELDELQQAWQDTFGGFGPLLVLVTGEAGIGKSRLAPELAMRLRTAPAVVMQGTAQEDAIASLQPGGRGDRSSCAGDGAGRAVPTPRRARRRSRLLPYLPAKPAGTAGDLSVRRYRMVDAVAKLITGVSQGTPVLLILDDLHWADVATSSLIRHVLESRPDARLLVVATCREDAIPAGGHLREALQRLDRGHLLRRIRLAGIGEGDAAELAHGLIGRELPRELLALIQQEAGGSPFFVQELLRDLGETGSTGLLSLRQAEVPTAA